MFYMHWLIFLFMFLNDIFVPDTNSL